MSEDSAWRPFIAALANANTRQVYAEIVAGATEPGSSISPSRRRHAITALLQSGLVIDLHSSRRRRLGDRAATAEETALGAANDSGAETRRAARTQAAATGPSISTLRIQGPHRAAPRRLHRH